MRIAPTLFFSAAMLWSGATFAQQTDGKALSAELKQHGDESLRGGDFKGAVRDYDEAYSLDANPAILYNRSRALEGMGEFTMALDSLERFERDASPELKARVPKLDALMKEQRAHVAMIAVTCPVKGAVVAIRDRDAGTVPLPSPLRANAGPATVEVRADGYQTFHLSMDLPGGSLTTIDAPLLRIGEKPPPPPGVVEKKRSKVPSIILAGGAALLAGAGVVSLVLRETDARTLIRNCPDGLCPIDRQKEFTATRDRAMVEGPLAAAFFIGAGVTMGVAVLLWPFGSSKTSTNTNTSARLTFGDRAVMIEGTF